MCLYFFFFFLEERLRDHPFFINSTCLQNIGEGLKTHVNNFQNTNDSYCLPQIIFKFLKYSSGSGGLKKAYVLCTCENDEKRSWWPLTWHTNLTTLLWQNNWKYSFAMGQLGLHLQKVFTIYKLNTVNWTSYHLRKFSQNV